MPGAGTGVPDVVVEVGVPDPPEVATPPEVEVEVELLVLVEVDELVLVELDELVEELTLPEVELVLDT